MKHYTWIIPPPSFKLIRNDRETAAKIQTCKTLSLLYNKMKKEKNNLDKFL